MSLDEETRAFVEDCIKKLRWVLVNLSLHNGGAMMQTELANLMDLGKVALGGLIDRLEANGYVRRRTEPDDRRVAPDRVQNMARARTRAAARRTTRQDSYRSGAD